MTVGRPYSFDRVVYHDGLLTTSGAHMPHNICILILLTRLTTDSITIETAHSLKFPKGLEP